MNITDKHDQKIKKLPPWDLYSDQIACDDLTQEQVTEEIDTMNSSCKCTNDGWVFDKSGGMTFTSQIGCHDAIYDHAVLNKTDEQIAQMKKDEDPAVR